MADTNGDGGVDWAALVAQANAIAMQWYQASQGVPQPVPIPAGQAGATVTLASQGAAVTISPAFLLIAAAVVIGAVILLDR
jgi:hypothetical protein